MEDLNCYQKLIRRTMPSQEPEEHSKCYHHRSTALGLQIQDNNSTSHLQDINPTHNAGCFPLLPDEGRGPKTSAWELSLQVHKQQFMVKIFTLANIRRYKWSSNPDRDSFLFSSSFCCSFLFFWNGYNSSGSVNSRPRNYMHSRSKSKQIKNKILFISQPWKLIHCFLFQISMRSHQERAWHIVLAGKNNTHMEKVQDTHWYMDQLKFQNTMSRLTRSLKQQFKAKQKLLELHV